MRSIVGASCACTDADAAMIASAASAAIARRLFPENQPLPQAGLPAGSPRLPKIPRYDDAPTNATAVGVGRSGPRTQVTIRLKWPEANPRGGGRG